MGVEHWIANAFRMKAKSWERHANPWSVWTRYLTLPFIVLTIWSRAWIGTWCLIPLAVLLIWAWLNPRFFPKPSTTKHWSSKGVLGERVWLNRKQAPIPPSHQSMANALALLGGLSIVPLIYGLWYLDLYTTLWSVLFINVLKTWFLDRMVWLFETMKHVPEYASWEY